VYECGVDLCVRLDVVGVVLVTCLRLQYDHLLADGKKYNYGEGGYCITMARAIK
jgi:hypothetical protein